MVVQIIAALVGSVGFAIFFKMKGKQIALAGIGGAVTWMVYLFVQSFVTGYFVPYFAAAVFVAVALVVAFFSAIIYINIKTVTS